MSGNGSKIWTVPWPPATIAIVTAALLTALIIRPSGENLSQDSQPPSVIISVPLPDPGIHGFQFPALESVVQKWITDNDQAAISAHSWGVWTALMQETDQVFEGQKLRVFETWDTPSSLATRGVKRPISPRPLEPLRQLLRTKRQKRIQDETGVKGFVKFDPTAANHITTEQLLSKRHLSTLVAPSQAAIPAFPVTATSLKSVWMTIPASQLVQKRYFRLTTWPGPPTPVRPFPIQEWHQCVWVDIQRTNAVAHGTGIVDTTCSDDGSSRTDASTYGVGQFVNFRLNASQVRAVNAGRSPIRATATGDYAILVAMHVTTREIERWTWQTFWWAPDTEKPTLPSSASMASGRPKELSGAPRNYAGCTAYATETPVQPTTGGTNVGESVYCYNPYLEASFDSDTLPLSKPGKSNGQTVSNNVGVQTNCMSCHAFAHFPQTTLFYAGDRYVDLQDKMFDRKLKVDFLWSISDLAQ